MTGRPPILGVAVGGAAGTLARYGLLVAFPVESGQFPWTTLAINLAGSFLIAVLLVKAPDLRLLLGTGFLGGFTTMSAVAVEADLLVSGGHAATAAAYLAASIAGAMAAVAAGSRAARR